MCMSKDKNGCIYEINCIISFMLQRLFFTLCVLRSRYNIIHADLENTPPNNPTALFATDPRFDNLLCHFFIFKWHGCFNMQSREFENSRSLLVKKPWYCPETGIFRANFTNAVVVGALAAYIAETSGIMLCNVGSCFPWENICNTYAISLSRNDRKRKHIFHFKKCFAGQGLIFRRLSTMRKQCKVVMWLPGDNENTNCHSQDQKWS